MSGRAFANDRGNPLKQERPPVFLVSLEDDRVRRVELARRFPIHFEHMEWVAAVDGRKLDAKAYFDQIFKAVSFGYRMMSPSEVGCTMSHIKVLKQFLESGRPSALIVEDDVIGSDADLSSVLADVEKMPEESVIIFGGQEGMPSRKYIFGKPSSLADVSELPRYSNSFVLRTCCYGVTRTSAKEILKAHEEYLKLADAWGVFFKNSTVKILFVKKLFHPVDRSKSHIENGRVLIKKDSGHSVFGIMKKRVMRARRKYGALVCYLLGYRRVG